MREHLVESLSLMTQLMPLVGNGTHRNSSAASTDDPRNRPVDDPPDRKTEFDRGQQQSA